MLSILRSPFLSGLEVPAPDPWMAALQAAILIGIVVVPITVQAVLGMWWLRRRVRRSGASAPLNLGWFLGQALGFWLFCSVLGFAAVFGGGALAKNMGNALGYLGFALLALMMLYAGLGLVIGLVVAAGMWRVQQKDS